MIVVFSLLVITGMLVIVNLEIFLSTSNKVFGQQQQVEDTNSGSSNNKVVILTFGDTYKSQFTTAKPILDKYGFKASFFITCSYADDQNKTRHLSWDDISALQEDGQDIESKGMTPVDLNYVSPKALGFETANSKQCLENHGVNSPNIFAPKYGNV